MKKTVIGILAPIIALFLVTTSVLAAGNGNGKNYVDSDGDGVCDNRNVSLSRNGNGSGKNYVDSDGDGVCDNRYGNSRGNGMGGCRNR